MSTLPRFKSLKPMPRPLTPAEIEHGIRISLAEGVLASAFSLLVGGTFFNALVIKLGAGAKELGFLASLGPFSTVFQLIIPRLQEKVRSRRQLMLWLVTLGRSLAFSVILVPSLLPKAWWMPALAGLTLIRAFIGQLDNNTYQDWMADLIPIERRSSYWGLRHTLCGPVGIILPFAIGWALDRCSGFTGFRLLYLIALPFMVADILLFFYQDEPPRQRGGRMGGRSMLRTLDLAPFRGYLLFFGLWNLLQGATSPYTSYIMFKVDRLPYTFVSALTVVATVTGTLLYMVWGRTQDRFGVRRVYRHVLPLLAVVTGMWGFVNARRTGLYLFLFALAGALNSALMVGGFSLLMSIVPERERFVYLSVNSIIMGMAGFLAPNIGALGIELLERLKLQWFTPHTPAVQQLFIFGGFGSLMLGALFSWFVRPPERTE